MPKPDGAKFGPFFAPTNVRGVTRLPPDVRRVVILPVHGPRSLTDDALKRLDETLLAELGRTARFELVPLARAELSRLVGPQLLSSTDAFPPEFLARIARQYAADAVLFTDVTAHSAYRPLVLGLRTKLARTDGAELLWSTDVVYSAADQPTVNSARKYALETTPAKTPGDRSHAILQNPTRFAAYAFSSLLGTLPPR